MTSKIILFPTHSKWLPPPFWFSFKNCFLRNFPVLSFSLPFKIIFKFSSWRILCFLSFEAIGINFGLNGLKRNPSQQADRIAGQWMLGIERFRRLEPTSVSNWLIEWGTRSPRIAHSRYERILLAKGIRCSRYVIVVVVATPAVVQVDSVVKSNGTLL